MVVKVDQGLSSIEGNRCTFATPQIREHIMSLAKEGKDFDLPDYFTYDIIPSVGGGFVAKIKTRK